MSVKRKVTVPRGSSPTARVYGEAIPAARSAERGKKGDMAMPAQSGKYTGLPALIHQRAEMATGRPPPKMATLSQRAVKHGIEPFPGKRSPPSISAKPERPSPRTTGRTGRDAGQLKAHAECRGMRWARTRLP